MQTIVTTVSSLTLLQIVRILSGQQAMLEQSLECIGTANQEGARITPVPGLHQRIHEPDVGETVKAFAAYII